MGVITIKNRRNDTVQWLENTKNVSFEAPS